MLLPNIKVILVSPKYSGNVGSTARVVTNFGIKDFAVVAPQCDVFDKQARMFGKGPARETLINVKTFDNLKDAVEDCDHVVAITKRYGEWHPEEVKLGKLAEFSGRHSRGKIALVFGREDNCLLHDEMLLCDHFCEIPTHEEMPTLNLSHSVAAVLAHVYYGLQDVEVRRSQDELPLAGSKEFEDLMAHFKNVIIDVGYDSAGNPERMEGRIRRVLQRSQLKSRDVGIWRALLSKIQVKLGTRQNNRGEPQS